LNVFRNRVLLPWKQQCFNIRIHLKPEEHSFHLIMSSCWNRLNHLSNTYDWISLPKETVNFLHHCHVA